MDQGQDWPVCIGGLSHVPWNGKTSVGTTCEINRRTNLNFNQALGLAHNGVVIFGCYTGIGTPDADMGIGTMMEAAKVCIGLGRLGHL